jgi:Tfp pilus assembly protein PilV
MTLIEVIASLVIFGLFIFGFSQAFLPVYNAWDTAVKDSRTARTAHFIAKSFQLECAKPDRSIERWKKAVSAAKELENYEIIELRKGDILWALKLTCSISSERLEIIGVCTP